MKTTIDLTENNKFKDKEIRSRYRHYRKRLPWKENYKDECVNLKPLDEFIPYTTFSYNPSTTDWLISMNDNRLSSAWRFIQHETSSTYSNSSFHTTYYHSDDSQYNFRIDKYTYSISSTEIVKYKEAKYNIKKYGDFYTGCVKSIRGLYKNNVNKDKERKYNSNSICNSCCKEIKGAAIFKDNSYVNVDRYICDKCKDRNRRSKYMYRRHKTGIRMFQPDNYYNAIRVDEEPTIPCVSNDIPQDRENPKYAGHDVLLYYSLYEYDSVLNNNELRHALYKANRVYKKGQSLHGRQQPFQPKGRIRQDYDELFNKLKWKDMIGEK